MARTNASYHGSQLEWLEKSNLRKAMTEKSYLLPFNSPKLRRLIDSKSSIIATRIANGHIPEQLDLLGLLSSELGSTSRTRIEPSYRTIGSMWTNETANVAPKSMRTNCERPLTTILIPKRGKEIRHESVPSRNNQLRSNCSLELPRTPPYQIMKLFLQSAPIHSLASKKINHPSLNCAEDHSKDKQGPDAWISIYTQTLTFCCTNVSEIWVIYRDRICNVYTVHDPAAFALGTPQLRSNNRSGKYNIERERI
ncbi:hypothetical protein CIHG_04713 [Coccidioides immitis H538.4]|uniref:Uncharacterized protein n=2 Tax=Coccidioides immitis TaxID=5501 RepID=A0A0J8UIG5_COCIT|nr:hypothetical protein CIRG_08133 [Coccidioides immitis RMSCC 2394]KMU87268.1 hypothetical protein CIHG_04713 [Coccidioides immitis H538.4]